MNLPSLDLEPIKKRLRAATPGPWRWREGLIREKYMARLRNGTWRAKPGRKAQDVYVYFLAGAPIDRGWGAAVSEDELFLSGRIDEWDFRRVMTLRWGQVKGTSFSGGPSRKDMDLIAAAPEDIRALLAEVECLREEVGRLRVLESLQRNRGVNGPSGRVCAPDTAKAGYGWWSQEG